LVVLAAAKSVSAKLIVTVSPGSTTPLVGRQLSASSVAAPVRIGVVLGGTSKLIRLVPMGVPQPVQRS
jgi:hypothetical protein